MLAAFHIPLHSQTQSLRRLVRSLTAAPSRNRDLSSLTALQARPACTGTASRTDWGELTLHEGTPQDHAVILEALMKRDAKLARERTKAHLLYARRSLLGGTG
jgi:DNA-binding GntR family transcriptional regulator